MTNKQTFILVIAVLVYSIIALMIEASKVDYPLVILKNPRADYIWHMSPNFHAFVVCILFIIVAAIIVKVIDYFKGKK